MVPRKRCLLWALITVTSGILLSSATVRAEVRLPLYFEGETARAEAARVAVCLVLITDAERAVSPVFLRAGLLISALLRRGDGVCVISGTQSPTRILPYTVISETDQILSSLKRADYRGGPHVFAALAVAQAELSKDTGVGPLAKEIIVLSDAETPFPRIEFSAELACRLRFEGTRISSIGYGSGHAESDLSELALRSTGVYRFAPSEQQLQMQLEHFIPKARECTRYAEQEFGALRVSYRESDYEDALLLLAVERENCHTAPEMLNEQSLSSVEQQPDSQKVRWHSFIGGALLAAELQDYRRVLRMIEERLANDEFANAAEERTRAEHRVLKFYRRLVEEERFGLLRKYLLAARFGQRERVGARDAV